MQAPPQHEQRFLDRHEGTANGGGDFGQRLAQMVMATEQGAAGGRKPTQTAPQCRNFLYLIRGLIDQLVDEGFRVEVGMALVGAPLGSQGSQQFVARDAPDPSPDLAPWLIPIAAMEGVDESEMRNLIRINARWAPHRQPAAQRPLQRLDYDPEGFLITIDHPDHGLIQIGGAAGVRIGRHHPYIRVQ